MHLVGNGVVDDHCYYFCVGYIAHLHPVRDDRDDDEADDS